MTYLLRALVVAVLCSALHAWAVYAPVPEQELGQNLILSLKGSVAHDSNVFGAPTNEVSSMIYTLAPRAVYNGSLTDQTFVAGSYGLTLDHFDNRPGDKTLDSHDATFRVAHAFTKSTTIDLNDIFTLTHNPEALLPGVAAALPTVLNPDQSFTRNQIDGRFETPLSAKSVLDVKARSVLYDYHEGALGRSLDRVENLYGLSVDYGILPEIKAVAEYRHQDVFYRKEGRELKNKRSDYLMVGGDYFVAKKMSLSARFGAEWRTRAAEADTTAPYVEVSGKYNYTESSFIVGGYAYTFDETSDTVRFNDTQVHRFFVNVQHSLTALIVASGSFSYEPSELQGRRGQRDVPEDTIRLGGALNYLPTKNWVLSASYDYDRVWSGLDVREMKRERAGLQASYSFSAALADRCPPHQWPTLTPARTTRPSPTSCKCFASGWA